MALSTIIKYEGDNSTFVWKYPGDEFNCMTELIVHEGQEAIFLANGKIADYFGPGRYKLDAHNIPILTSLLDIVTGVSVFHCDVYFVNKTVQMAVKWGTDTKVRLIEPTYGVPIEIGASGEMNLAVSDGQKLLTKLVGTMNTITWNVEENGFTKSLQSCFKPLISTAVKSNLASAIKNKEIDIIEVDEHLMELSEALGQYILLGFAQYGLTIPQFYITSIVPTFDENFNRLRELHTISIQKKIVEAESEVKLAQIKGKELYMTAEANAEAQIKAAQRAIVLEEQMTDTEVARREAERKLIQAQAEAQITQMSGIAEATVMQAKGYSQKDVLQAEVQKAYAEGIGNMGTLGSSGGGSSVVGEIMGLGVGMAAMGTMAPQVTEMMKGFNFCNNEKCQESADGMIKKNGVCSGCGKELLLNAKFCPECGTKTDNLTEEEVICIVCGKNIPKGKFCIECGAKL